LASAREHPAAAVVRQQQRDLALMAATVRDFSDRQSELFLLVVSFLKREGAASAGTIDEDVAGAAGAVARTFETASRGVIYEHRPASLPADRLAGSLTAMLREAGRKQPASFERDAAVVLKRVEEAVARSADPSNRRAWLDLVGRVTRASDRSSEPAVGADPGASRLIVP
jgi:hypothetical protein